jgi:uncharacterized membrane protein
VEELLHTVGHYLALGLEAIAMAVIAFGALQAVFGILRLAFLSAVSNQDRRHVWLMFARWLVAGMTFQLAADIVNTSLAPTWDELGHLATVAAIRTFLSFFLDRELDETRNVQHRPEAANLPP